MKNIHVKVLDYIGEKGVVSGSTLSITKFSIISIWDRPINHAIIKKLIDIDHGSVLEHAVFTIGFDGVSIAFEQFLIEHRLASYTIKSRRSVRHYSCINGIGEEKFKIYSKLIDAGVPLEDARFVLPYSTRSQILCTVNARELRLILSRLTGDQEREIIYTQLIQQLNNIAPNLFNDIKFKLNRSGFDDMDMGFGVDLLDHHMGTNDESTIFTFLVRGLSLSGLTHLTRHRIISLIAADLDRLSPHNHIIPRSIPLDLLEMYHSAFNFQNSKYTLQMGHCCNPVFTINLRSLQNFFKSCCSTRAQWEIRGVANKMVQIVQEYIRVMH